MSKNSQLFPIVAAVLAALLVAGCTGGKTAAPPGASPAGPGGGTAAPSGAATGATTAAPGDGKTLRALKVKDPPSGPADPAWSKAQPLQVRLTGADVEPLRGKTADVTVKALWTDSELHMLFRWQDATQSMVKGAWKFDGKAWSKQKGDEDRLALAWEITSIDKFATKGCAVLCHSTDPDPKKWYMATNSPTEKADLWHWKSYRSSPLGFADDGFIVESPDKKGGRKSDPGSGGDEKNEAASKDRPKWVQDPAKKPSAPGFLLKDEAVEIKDDSAFKAGDVVPFRTLSKPGGSRGDIKATGTYQDGGWTVWMSRKLDTGHDDDVKFNTAKTNTFGLAVYENAGDEFKYTSNPLKLTFVK